MPTTMVLRSHKVRKECFFRRLPPELRLMIYNIALLNPTEEVDEKLLVDESPKPYPRVSFKLPSKTLHPAPEFLAALRADSKLYSEALVVFYKLNTFPLTKDSFVIFDNLKRPALELIQQMCIFFTKDDLNYWNKRLVYNSRSKLYTRLPKLRNVELLLDYSTGWDLDQMSKHMGNYWLNLERVVLKQVEYYGPPVPVVWHAHSICLRRYEVDAGTRLVKELNLWLEEDRDWEWGVVAADYRGKEMYVQVLVKVDLYDA